LVRRSGKEPVGPGLPRAEDACEGMDRDEICSL